MKKFLSVMSIFVGIAAIVLSIVCFTMSVGGYEPYKSYGGDAYTGMQNASAQTANNVQDVAAISKFGFGSVLMIWGCLTIINSCKELAEDTPAKGEDDLDCRGPAPMNTESSKSYTCPNCGKSVTYGDA